MLKNCSKSEETEVLLEKLQDIKEQKGIIGYILRDTKSASIDLKDPTRIIEYAILSSTASDVGQKMLETLQIGEVDNIIVECEDKKLLSKNYNDQQVTIFMEKNVDHNKVFKNLK